MSIIKSHGKAQFSIPWTPVNEYPELIMARSKSRGWGFTQAEVDKLAKALQTHRDILTPTAVNIWLGRNLKFNWTEAMLWLTDEVLSLGCNIETYFGKGRLSFLPGSERCGSRKLSAVCLDLSNFCESDEAINTRKLRTIRPSWPGLEIAFFLALNPHVFITMNGVKSPFMFAPGIIYKPGGDYYSVGTPHFSCENREARVVASESVFRYPKTVVASFRRN